jgi:hypothetical protein
MDRVQLQAKKDAGTVLTAEEETFLASSESSSVETPPTPTPAPSATDQSQRYIGILEETLRDQNRQIQELMNTRPAAPAAAAAPVVDTEKEKQEFYNDPMGATRRIINEALADSIKPLQDFVKGLKIDGSPFSNMMAKFKGDARFAEVLNDTQVVAAVEKIMEKAELTEVNMQSAIVHASGLKAMGLLGTVVAAPAPAAAPATPPAPAPAPSTVLPPHVRPSAAPTPAPAPNGNKPVRPPMTENHRRLMREQGFKTEEEYWQWMDMSAAEVAESKLGQTPAGGR